MGYVLPYRREPFQYPLANGVYGFPHMRDPRRIKPSVLMCLHITGNASTAAAPAGIGPGSGTLGEVEYMARPYVAGGHYNSAHVYVARNGDYLDCIPTRFAAWNNGDVNKPNLTIPTVRAIVAALAQGINANEWFVREIEMTGFPGSHPVNAAQLETAAYLIATDSIEHHIPINRSTVLAHADIDSVNRAACPFPPATREAQLAGVINRAIVIKELMAPGTTTGDEGQVQPLNVAQEGPHNLAIPNGTQTYDLAGNELTKVTFAYHVVSQELVTIGDKLVRYWVVNLPSGGGRQLQLVRFTDATDLGPVAGGGTDQAALDAARAAGFADAKTKAIAAVQGI